MEGRFTDNQGAGRFEWQEAEGTAFAAYRLEGQTLYINYVEAPENLRGTGAAGRLMGQIVTLARARHYEIVPICGYAAAWLRRHPPAP